MGRRQHKRHRITLYLAWCTGVPSGGPGAACALLHPPRDPSGSLARGISVPFEHSDPAMNLRKAFAVAVSTAILGAQSGAVVLGSDYYWPFIDYPMYSRAAHVGDAVARYELRGLSCDASRQSFVISNNALRLGPYRFENFLRAVAARQSADSQRRSSVQAADRAAQYLSELIELQIERPVCAVQVWEQSLLIGDKLPQGFAVPWKLMHEWQVADDGGSAAGAVIREPNDPSRQQALELSQEVER